MDDENFINQSEFHGNCRGFEIKPVFMLEPLLSIISSFRLFKTEEVDFVLVYMTKLEDIL